MIEWTELSHNIFLPKGSGYLPRVMKWSEWRNFENGEKKKCKSDTTTYHPIMRFRGCSNFVLPSGLVKISTQFEWLSTFKICKLLFLIWSWKWWNLGKCVWCGVWNWILLSLGQCRLCCPHKLWMEISENERHLSKWSLSGKWVFEGRCSEQYLAKCIEEEESLW